MTGLAGGDHLHFTMLVNGQMVNPVEWWDPHWIEDRILRKLRSTAGHAARPRAGLEIPWLLCSRLTHVLRVIASLLAGQPSRLRRLRSSAAPRPARRRADAKRVDQATAAQARAAACSFEGPAAAEPADQDDGDPACERANPRGRAVRDVRRCTNGGLDNVFVYVKDGLGNYYFETPTEPVKLDQRAAATRRTCSASAPGSRSRSSTATPTLHNVHALPQANQEFNFRQQIQGMKNRRRSPRREVMVPFKCDVHGWMNAYAGVLDHPYFAVTSRRRTVRAEGPAGGHLHDRSLAREARHADADGHVGEKETKDISFTFKAARRHH